MPIHGRITLVLHFFVVCLLAWLLCCNAMILHVLIFMFVYITVISLVHLHFLPFTSLCIATSFDKPLCIEPEIDSLTVFWFSGVSPML